MTTSLDKSHRMDWAGLQLDATQLKVGSTVFAESDLSTNAGVTPGTAAASKAVVLDSSKNIAGLGTLGFGAGGKIDLDSAAISCTGTGGTSTATQTTQAAVVTTAALTTAGGASHVITITYTGVAAGDLTFVSLVGGTNTTKNLTLQAATTSNTVTVTIFNNTAATAVNGTIIFNLLVCKQ